MGESLSDICNSVCKVRILKKTLKCHPANVFLKESDFLHGAPMPYNRFMFLQLYGYVAFGLRLAWPDPKATRVMEATDELAFRFISLSAKPTTP